MVKSTMVAVVVGCGKPSRPQSALVKPFYSTFHRKHLMVIRVHELKTYLATYILYLS